MNRVLSVAVLALALSVMADAAQAQEQGKKAWYKGIYVGAGAGAGRLEAKIAKLGVLPDSQTSAPPCGATDSDCLETTDFGDTAITSKFFVGYRIIDWLAIEGGYVKFHDLDDQPCFLAEKDDTDNNPPACTDSIPGALTEVPAERQWDVTVPLDGWTAYLVGIWPINETFELFGKAGAIFWEMEPYGRERIVGGFIPCNPTTSNPSCGPGNPVPSPTNASKQKQLDGTDVALGFGMNFNNTSGITIRSEFEWFDIGVAEESWLVSLSAIYNF